MGRAFSPCPKLGALTEGVALGWDNAAGQSHEAKWPTIRRAFSPPNSRLASETQGDALGWDSGAPSALGSADNLGMFPIRIAVRIGVKQIHAIALDNAAPLALICGLGGYTCRL
jgi:hypothetical protein